MSQALCLECSRLKRFGWSPHQALRMCQTFVFSQECGIHISEALCRESSQAVCLIADFSKVCS